MMEKQYDFCRTCHMARVPHYGHAPDLLNISRYQSIHLISQYRNGFNILYLITLLDTYTGLYENQNPFIGNRKDGN